MFDRDLIIGVGALSVVNVTGEHVVVHIDGAAVVDGIAKSLSHDDLARVGRQTQLEETRLGGGQAVMRLEEEEQRRCQSYLSSRTLP